jgi:ESS family glutamate:Na+ symporter
MLTLNLDMMQTLAMSAVVLFAGYGIRRRVWVLDRYNIPAPVVGGFLFAAAALVLRVRGLVSVEFDTALQVPLMIAFFTTIGLGASMALLKVGGPQVLVFWGLASGLAVIQNAIGVGLTTAMGVHPFLGLIAGSITLTGGHGTGAAFGKVMEDQYGFQTGVTLAMAAATFGLVSGGLIGGPIGTWLIRRHRAAPAPVAAAVVAPVALANTALDAEIDTEPAGEAATAYTLLKTLTILLVAMWAGSLLSRWAGQYLTLPAYIGAMVAAAAIRNGDVLLNRLHIQQRVVDDLGTIALSLFLTMALMTLRLWELVDLAVPMIVILIVQVALMAAFAVFVTFPMMGRDYDSAVMASGHCGFGLGSTANAVANMEALTERFGASPRAFLVIPMVGGFFVDFTNSLIITAYLNLVA